MKPPISDFTEIAYKGKTIYQYSGKPLDGKYGVDYANDEVIFDNLNEAKQFIDQGGWNNDY